MNKSKTNANIKDAFLVVEILPYPFRKGSPVESTIHLEKWIDRWSSHWDGEDESGCVHPFGQGTRQTATALYRLDSFHIHPKYLTNSIQFEWTSLTACNSWLFARELMTTSMQQAEITSNQQRSKQSYQHKLLICHTILKCGNSWKSVQNDALMQEEQHPTFVISQFRCLK